MFPYENATSTFEQTTLGGAIMTRTLLSSSTYPDGVTLLGIEAHSNNNTRPGSDWFSCGSDSATNRFMLLNASSTRAYSDMIMECPSLVITTDNSASHTVTYNVTFLPYHLSTQNPMSTLTVSLTIGIALALALSLFYFLAIYLKNR